MPVNVGYNPMDPARYQLSQQELHQNKLQNLVQTLLAMQKMQEEQDWRSREFDYESEQDKFKNLLDERRVGAYEQAVKPQPDKPRPLSDFETKVKFYVDQGMSPIEAAARAQGQFPDVAQQTVIPDDVATAIEKNMRWSAGTVSGMSNDLKKSTLAEYFERSRQKDPKEPTQKPQWTDPAHQQYSHIDKVLADYDAEIKEAVRALGPTSAKEKNPQRLALAKQIKNMDGVVTFLRQAQGKVSMGQPLSPEEWSTVLKVQDKSKGKNLPAEWWNMSGNVPPPPPGFIIDK